MLIGTRRSLLGVGGRYIDKVLSVEPGNLIGLWLQNEGSGSVSYDFSGNAHDGTYTGVTLGQPGVLGMGYTSPFYDGANDENYLTSADLITAIGTGGEWTYLAWAKMNNVGVWTDGAERYFAYFQGDPLFRLMRTTTNNELKWSVALGGTWDSVTTAGHSDTGWMCLGVTVSQAADDMKAWKNGVQEGLVQHTLGTAVGPSTYQTIGRSSTGGAGVFHGWLGPALLYTKALTAAQILYLSSV